MGREQNKLGGREQWNIRVERKGPDSIITQTHTFCAQGNYNYWLVVSERVFLGSACSISLYPDLRMSKKMLIEWAEKKGGFKMGNRSCLYSREYCFQAWKVKWRCKCSGAQIYVICCMKLHKKTNQIDKFPHSRKKFYIKKTLMIWDMRWFWGSNFQIALKKLIYLSCKMCISKKKSILLKRWGRE